MLVIGPGKHSSMPPRPPNLCKLAWQEEDKLIIEEEKRFCVI